MTNDHAPWQLDYILKCQEFIVGQRVRTHWGDGVVERIDPTWRGGVWVAHENGTPCFSPFNVYPIEDTSYQVVGSGGAMTHEPSDASVALLPCPFCGQSPELADTYWADDAMDDGYYVRCECDLYMFSPTTKEKAIAAWNRRSPSLHGLLMPDEKQRPYHTPMTVTEASASSYADGQNDCREEGRRLNRAREIEASRDGGGWPELPTPLGPWHATSKNAGYYTYTPRQLIEYGEACRRMDNAEVTEAMDDLFNVINSGLTTENGGMEYTLLGLSNISTAMTTLQSSWCRRMGKGDE